MMGKKKLGCSNKKKLCWMKGVSMFKKKRLLNKVLHYLKSDLYMFAPLLQPSTGTPDPEQQVVSMELHSELRDYLKTDFYLYAPLLNTHPCLYASNFNQHYSGSPHKQDAGTDGQSELMKKVSEDRNKQQDRKATTITNEDQQMNGRHPRTSSRPILRHTTILQQETVKHVVHRKRISPSVPGKGSVAEEARKPVAKSR